MKKNYYLLLICFCAVFNAIAAQNTTTELTSLKEKVNRAIIKFENTNKELWAYKISRYEDEEGDISSSIEQHFPQARERWILRKMNGQLPTKKQIIKFAKEKHEQNQTHKQTQKMQLSLRKLINPDSLSLVSTDEKHMVMAFNVYIKKLGKDSIGKLQGQLIYQKEQQFIEKISIWNNAEFSPMLTAKISDLAITFTFLDINGAILAKQNEMKMKGSFAYFTDINETSIDNFSEYLYQGKQLQ
jgi:macrodomain Ter protein organizer (MatP/YcbG family)